MADGVVAEGRETGPSEGWHDVVVVGSGFGGAVSALRLAEKGWEVVVLEQGRRFADDELARAGTSLRALAWAPTLGLTGPFAQEVFRHVGVVRGVGVGGGSLVYAAVLLEPKDSFFRDPAWRALSPDWKAELAPHYATARRMLGVADNPYRGVQDEWLAQTARALGAEASYGTVPQGIYFGPPDSSTADPYFGGEGPARRGCSQCGRCITGCAHGAKNSLDRNYLFLAQRRGVQVWPLRRVTHLEALPAGGYLVHQRHPVTGASYPPMRARTVVLAGGVLGTLELLFASRDGARTLPALPASLGHHVRTNSEAIVGILSETPGLDVTRGTTISSHFHADERTHLTQNRFPESYEFMRLYMGPLVDEARPLLRALRVLWALLRHPWRSTRSWWTREWFKRVSILTVMQQADNELAFSYGRTLLRLFRRGLRSRVAVGQRSPSYLPQANAAARAFATASGGTPLNILPESLANLSVTAHVLGGAVMAEGPEGGVVDASHQVFGHPGLYVVDGSVVPANVGVNPSLTITALAERFAARFPAKPR